MVVGPVGGAQTHQSKRRPPRQRRFVTCQKQRGMEWNRTKLATRTVEVVYEAGLALGGGPLGGGVTDVVTALRTTRPIVGIDLVWLR